jgi:hypothetical protein
MELLGKYIVLMAFNPVEVIAYFHNHNYREILIGNVMM